MKSQKPLRATAAAMLRELRRVRTQFTRLGRTRKRALLSALERNPPRTTSGLIQYHDHLLFLSAFPDDSDTRDLAHRGLTRLPDLCRRLGRARLRRAEGTGMTGTETTCVLGGELVGWLTHAYPGELQIDWPAVHNQEDLDVLLRPALLRAEEDGFESGTVSTREWLRTTRRKGTDGDLGWLLRRCPTSGSARRAWVIQYDALEIPVRWSLTRSTAATTVLRWPRAPRSFRSTGLRSPPGRPRAVVAERLPDIILLDLNAAEEAIDVARAALASRGREVDAISLANPREVYMADIGPGVVLILMGATPDARMSLESNYGYIVLANGIPYGYGGVTPLFHQANTGINVFPTFRKSEAPAIYAQVLRAFRTLFGVTRFITNPYQLGEGNPEAIASGAFWFYYRLGFRPRDTVLRRLAASEFKLVRGGNHRTDRKTLRALGNGDVILELGPSVSTPLFEESWLGALGLAVTEAAPWRTGDRSRTRGVVRRVSSALGVSPSARAGWKRPEREAFTHLAPLVSMLPVEQWSVAERRALVRLMRSKGAPQERDFVLGAQTLPRFFEDLATLAHGLGGGGGR